jgi:hypothetical protein
MKKEAVRTAETERIYTQRRSTTSHFAVLCRTENQKIPPCSRGKEGCSFVFNIDTRWRFKVNFISEQTILVTSEHEVGQVFGDQSNMYHYPPPGYEI